MKVVVSFSVTIISLFLSGCISYRFQGNVTQTSGNSSPTLKRYRVDNIINNSGNGPFSMGQGAFSAPDPWSIPAVAKRLEETTICSDIMRQNPNIFARSLESTPLEVEIRTRNESKEGTWSVFFPYLLTLGVFPAWMSTPSQCEITVTSLADRNIQRTCVVDLRSDMKLTAFSPIGLISYDHIPSAASCRTGAGIMKAPHIAPECLSDLQSVYTETIAEGIAVCIREMERETNTTAKTHTNAIKSETNVIQIDTLKEKLLRLKELQDSGILTKDEYEAKRKALVDQL